MAKIQKKSALIGLFILAAIAGIWRFIWQPAKENQPTSETTNVEVTTPSATQTIEPSAQSVGSETSTEKTASVKTSYSNPGGSDEVGFNITVNEAGIITKAAVEVLAKNPTSKMRQQAFAAGLPAAIEGKKLSDLTAIDRVGGSSLTTGSFNASLAELKAGI